MFVYFRLMREVRIAAYIAIYFALWVGAILAHCGLKDRNEAIPVCGSSLLNGLYYLGLALCLCTGKCGGQGLARHHILSC